MTKTSEAPRIYLDVCTLCRPFDDQSAMRIRLETDAYYLILQSIQDKAFQLATSPVHYYEVEAIKDLQERYKIVTLLKKFGADAEYQPDEVRKRAESLITQGFGVADAAHVAFAEATSEYFISCDDRLLNKCNRVIPKLKARNPVAFCIEVDLK